MHACIRHLDHQLIQNYIKTEDDTFILELKHRYIKLLVDGAWRYTEEKITSFPERPQRKEKKAKGSMCIVHANI